MILWYYILVSGLILWFLIMIFAFVNNGSTKLKRIVRIKARQLIKFFINWRFCICFLIAWMITNGWCYVFIVLGRMFHLNWMLGVGLGYLSFLWLPFTPEKVVTFAIAIVLSKIIFPKDKKLHSMLEERKQAQKLNNKKNKQQFSAI